VLSLNSGEEVIGNKIVLICDQEKTDSLQSQLARRGSTRLWMKMVDVVSRVEGGVVVCC
jgi:hypothetical protein